MIPSTFRKLAVLNWITNLTVGFSLASCTAAGLARIFGHSDDVALATGLPTLLIGTLWTKLLRRPETTQTAGIRKGWLYSVPLAALNAGIAVGLLASRNSLDLVAKMFFIGVTLGAIIWIPALILTLIAFGIPLWYSDRLAKEGLAGSERGELFVNTISLLLVLLSLSSDFIRTDRSIAGIEGHARFVFVIPALLFGLIGVVISLSREARRRDFIQQAEAGKLPNYRVDATRSGKQLVRVSSTVTYRENDNEPLYELDAEGRAMWAKESGTI